MDTDKQQQTTTRTMSWVAMAWLATSSEVKHESFSCVIGGRFCPSVDSTKSNGIQNVRYFSAHDVLPFDRLTTSTCKGVAVVVVNVFCRPADCPRAAPPEALLVEYCDGVEKRGFAVSPRDVSGVVC